MQDVNERGQGNILHSSHSSKKYTLTKTTFEVRPKYLISSVFLEKADVSLDHLIHHNVIFIILPVIMLTLPDNFLDKCHTHGEELIQSRAMVELITD